MVRVPLIMILMIGLAGMGGCASKIVLSYPDTDAGGLLRILYTGTPVEAEKAYQALANMGDPSKSPHLSEADRAALQPVLLKMVGAAQSERALWAGMLLCEWDRTIAVKAREFRALLPMLVRTLDVRGEGTPGTRWTGTASAMLLCRMGPDATYSVRADVARRFNAPAREQIDGESDEGWERLFLAGLLSGYGKEGKPALAQGLRHSDSTVRDSALEAIRKAAQGAEAVDGVWDMNPAQVEAMQEAARGLAPEVAERLWDTERMVRKNAAAILPLLVTPGQLTARVRDRLAEVLAEP